MEFSIAAMIELAIFVIHDTLSVGDIAFYEKARNHITSFG